MKTISELKNYCLSKQGAFEDYPFGSEPTVIKVASKMFAIITDKTISLKCDPFVAINLRGAYDAVTAGYHLNKEHWNTVSIDGSVPDNEIIWMIDHSYELVYKGLTRVEKEQIK